MLSCFITSSNLNKSTDLVRLFIHFVHYRQMLQNPMTYNHRISLLWHKTLLFSEKDFIQGLKIIKFKCLSSGNELLWVSFVGWLVGWFDGLSEENFQTNTTTGAYFVSALV